MEKDVVSDLGVPKTARPRRSPSATRRTANYGSVEMAGQGSRSSPIPFFSNTDMHMSGFKKLARGLGFGIRGSVDTCMSPMSLGLINVIPDEEQDAPHSFGAAPLTKSIYRRMSMAGMGGYVPNPSTSSPTSPLIPSTGMFGLRTTDTQWAMNYREAAIYLEEGENNEQFCTHPKRTENLPAYLLAHAKWFHTLDMIVAILLLSLAAIESPTAEGLQVPLVIHTSIELGFLLIIGIGVVIKVRWMGVEPGIVKHPRTMIKTIFLIIMMAEAIVILVRDRGHYRISRAIRPVFLLDNNHFSGVRRFSRQILQCCPPILDMMVLLFFFMTIFALLGNFLFDEDLDDPFFRTIEDSFVNLFILLTTANYPDVMMPAYYKSRWNVLFFVTYLVLVLYFFMNLLLAVVYDSFTAFEKEKLQKLVLHKRNACNHAFHLLISRTNTHGIIFRHFFGMMMFYQPKKSNLILATSALRDSYLMFRTLDRSQDGFLSREEFSKFFEVCELNWKPLLLVPQKPWPIFRKQGVSVLKFLQSPYSEYIFNGIILLNTVTLFVQWKTKEADKLLWDSYIFAILFTLEMTLKTLTWGTARIVQSGWNLFDLLATILYDVSITLVNFFPNWTQLLLFVRPLRLMRLFKLKKRYRNVLGTLFILLRPMSAASMIMILVYYFFAIIGMEAFRDVQLRNCCNGTLIESYFVVPESNETFALRFYMNTFDNVFSSFVTLFELTVVNNWYVIMEGHTKATSRYSRIYFVVFYLSTVVLLNTIVASILDTFLFRMKYKRTINKNEEERLLRTEAFLNTEEINFCYHQHFQNLKKRTEILEDYGDDLANKGGVTYIGKSRRTKEILFRRIENDFLSNWIRENEDVHSS